MQPRIHVITLAVRDQPHDRPWGIYSGYFRDLDGHPWEIMRNPQLDLEATGLG